MPDTITLHHPDVVARIEALAERLTGGDTAQVAALAVAELERRDSRAGSLFGVMRGSVAVADRVDLKLLNDVAAA